MMAYGRFGQTVFGGFPSFGGQNPNGRYETDFWDFNNPNGRWPLPTIGANVENITNPLQFNDGSFVSVRHISLAYNVPFQASKKLGMNNLNVSVQVVNPFIFGGDVVRWGINPDDDTNWELRNAQGNPIGGMNSNTVLPQSFVFTLRAGF